MPDHDVSPTLAPPLPASTAAESALSPRLIVCLGLSQIIGWGTMHYLIALFAMPIGRELAWSPTFVQAGFSVSLLTMGASSAWVGRWIDRHGGRAAMMGGSWLGAVGCVVLATTASRWQYLAAWVLLGLAMRLALYDAAFATLARVGGASSRRAMSIVTLFGGLASTVFWPLGQQLGQALGWRGALWCYAAILVVASALHLAIPLERGGRAGRDPESADPAAPVPHPPPQAVAGAKWLYALIVAGVLFLQTGMAAHFIVLLTGRGWDAASAVAIAALLGIGQFCGRTCVVLWGDRLPPVRLNLVPSALICACFLLYVAAGELPWAAGAFAFLYGAGNGIATITRGAMPLVLFDTAQYGRIVGGLLKPAFALAALSPVAFAWVIATRGTTAAALCALAISAAGLGAAFLLHQRVHPRSPSP